MLEPSRTNYIPYSTLDFNGGSSPQGWTIGFGTGTYSYEQLNYKGQKAVKQTQVTTGRSYLDTGSISILANTQHTLKIQFILDECVADDDDFIVSFLFFGTNINYRFSDIDANGVLEIQYNPLSDNVGNIRIGLGCSQNEDGGKSLAWAIPQLEQGSYPTSYIPTQGSAVTRVAETANGSGNSEVFNDSEGVLFADISALANDGTSKRLTLSDGSISNRISLEFDEAANVLKVFSVTTGITVLQYTAQDLTLFNKISVKYKLNDFALWLNGFEVDTNNSVLTPSGLDRLNFDGGDLNNDFYGKTKEIAYYDTVLTDAELEYMTSYRSLSELVTELNLNTL